MAQVLKNSALKIPTDRSFGFTFAGVFTVLAAVLWWKGSQNALAVFGAAVLFGLVAVTVPRILHPLNVVWMYFGMLLNKIVSPIVLGAIFFLIFTPVSLIFRLTGRDVLRRSFERRLPSYWIERTPPGPEGKSFPRQF